MTSRIKAIRFAMDEEDQDLVGESIEDIKELREDQIYAIYNAINKNKAYTKNIDLNELNYVTDNEGFEGIISSEYNDYLKDYQLSPAYLADALPKLYRIMFNEEQKLCIIYLITTFDQYEKLFLNQNAVEVLKSMTLDEISSIITKAQDGRSRKRN